MPMKSGRGIARRMRRVLVARGGGRGQGGERGGERGGRRGERDKGKGARGEGRWGEGRADGGRGQGRGEREEGGGRGGGRGGGESGERRGETGALGETETDGNSWKCHGRLHSTGRFVTAVHNLGMRMP